MCRSQKCVTARDTACTACAVLVTVEVMFQACHWCVTVSRHSVTTIPSCLTGMRRIQHLITEVPEIQPGVLGMSVILTSYLNWKHPVQDTVHAHEPHERTPPVKKKDTSAEGAKRGTLVPETSQASVSMMSWATALLDDGFWPVTRLASAIAYSPQSSGALLYSPPISLSLSSSKNGTTSVLPTAASSELLKPVTCRGKPSCIMLGLTTSTQTPLLDDVHGTLTQTGMHDNNRSVQFILLLWQRNFSHRTYIKGIKF